MSTQPLYFGFRHLKTGTRILKNVSELISGMKDNSIKNKRHYTQEEISTFLCNLKLVDMKPDEYSYSIIYACFLLLTVTDSFNDHANFYLITIDETEDNLVRTAIDFAVVGNDHSAVSCFRRFDEELTTA